MATRALMCAVRPATPSCTNTSVSRCASSRRISSRPEKMLTFHAYHSGTANATSAASPSSRYPSAQVSADERISLFMGAHHVAGIAHRAHQRLLRVVLELSAQLADVHVDDVGLRVEVIVPHRFQQHGTRHHLVGVPH